MIKKFIYGFFIFGFVGASFECFKMFKSSNKAEDCIAALLALVCAYFLYRRGFKKKEYALASLSGQPTQVTRGEKEICEMIDNALSDGTYTVDEEQAILAKASQLGVSLDADSVVGKKAEHAAYYRDILAGIPRQPPMPWPPGFMSESGERLVWVWDADVSVWSENKMYVAGTSGVSYRLTSRITVRSAGTRGHIEKQEGFSLLGRGVVAVTNHALLYSSGGRAERIPLAKIVHVTQALDGVIVQLSGRGKPLAISTDDDAFFAVCLVNARLIS
ncbi:MAG: hypothetical protein IK129_07520 [Deltaproteobacteria bacterium]|nr:hypothetical protein [Deltaproteobacteria bacterium]